LREEIDFDFHPLADSKSVLQVQKHSGHAQIDNLARMPTLLDNRAYPRRPSYRMPTRPPHLGTIHHPAKSKFRARDGDPPRQP
jgi:hypothetical protein